MKQAHYLQIFFIQFAKLCIIVVFCLVDSVLKQLEQLRLDQSAAIGFSLFLLLCILVKPTRI